MADDFLLSYIDDREVTELFYRYTRGIHCKAFYTIEPGKLRGRRSSAFVAGKSHMPAVHQQDQWLLWPASRHALHRLVHRAYFAAASPSGGECRRNKEREPRSSLPPRRRRLNLAGPLL
jgi:hypothetical protein